MHRVAAQQLMITCPAGVAAGQPIYVRNPETGQNLQVTVPAGVFPGQQFRVQV